MKGLAVRNLSKRTLNYKTALEIEPLNELSTHSELNITANYEEDEYNDIETRQKHRLTEKEKKTLEWSKKIKPYVEKIINKWQSELPEIQISLHGSLVDGSFNFHEAEEIDVDIRMLSDQALYIEDERQDELIKKIEKVIGMKMDHSFVVGDSHHSNGSQAYMFLQKMNVKDFPIPLSFQVLLRSTGDVSITDLLNKLLTPKEKEQIKIEKRFKQKYDSDNEYRKFKMSLRQKVVDRAIKKGLIHPSQRDAYL